MPDSSSVIEIKHLKTVLNNRLIHKDINLKAKKGKTTVILGRSGCGKSVLLKILMKILKPVEGEVFFNQRNILNLNQEEMDEIRYKMSVVFQGSALFDSLNVYENVGFVYLQNKKLSKDEIFKRAQELLNWVGLNNVEHLYPGEISGGMKKRVGIARAIMTDPEIILFDEPTTGLDPIMTDVFNNIINKLREEKGVTSVVVTHDIGSAYKIADYVYILEQGEVIGEGTVEDIQNSLDQRIQQFITGKAEGPIKV